MLRSVLFVSFVLFQVSAIPPGKWKLQWADEFNGAALNESWWNIGTLAAKNGDLIPGSLHAKYLLNDGYAGYIMADDVLLDNGILSLRNQKRKIVGTDPKGNFDFSSGWIHTLHNVYYTYGYAEAKIRMPLGSKVWPAFWTIGENLVWGAEFDIGEYFGTAWKPGCNQTNGTTIAGENVFLNKHKSLEDCCKTCKNMANCAAAVWYNNGSCIGKPSATATMSADPNAILLFPGIENSHAGLHTGTGGKRWYENWYVLCVDNQDPKNCNAVNWHTYGLRWGPDGIAFYFDDQVMYSANAADIVEFPTKDMYFVLNNGVASAPPSDKTPWPNTVDYEYLRLYKEVGADGKLIGGPVVGV